MYCFTVILTIIYFKINNMNEFIKMCFVFDSTQLLHTHYATHSEITLINPPVNIDSGYNHPLILVQRIDFSHVFSSQLKVKHLNAHTTQISLYVLESVGFLYVQ